VIILDNKSSYNIWLLLSKGRQLAPYITPCIASSGQLAVSFGAELEHIWGGPAVFNN
jgi:hypothetical protein